MTKIHTLGLALILPVGALVAQPTLTSSNSVGNAGEEYPVTTGTSYTTPGPAGADLEYGFWDLAHTGNRIYTYLAPSVTSSSATVPTATVLSTDGGSDTLFWRIGSAGLELAGERIALVGAAFAYSDPPVELKLPCAYGDTWTDIFSANLTVSGFAAVRSGTVNGHADGYGAIELPNAILDDVLRVKVRKVIDDQSAIINIHRTQDIHYFYNGILGHPVLKLVLDTTIIGTGAPAVTKQTEWMYGEGEVGLEEIGYDDVVFRAYPNPATGPVDLAFTTDAKPERLEVADASGRVVLQRNLAGAHAGTVLVGAFDTATLAKGVYVVTVGRADGRRSAQRLVVR